MIEDFDRVEEFLQQVVAMVTMEEIPPELISAWYAEQLAQQLKDAEDLQPMNLTEAVI